jgi:hypothetical protein
LEQHVKILGILNIAMGVLALLMAGVGALFVAGSGAISGEAEAMAVTGLVGGVIGVLGLLFSIPAIIGGWFLMQHKEWARILVLVISALNLLSVPLGTALGIYGFWVLLKPEASSLFS